LVHLPTSQVRLLAIRLAAVHDQVEGTTDCDGDFVHLGGRLGEQSFTGFKLGRDPLLLVSEEVERDRVGVVRLQQLLAFALEAVDPMLLAITLGLVLPAHE
jgi:hypothetical protein